MNIEQKFIDTIKKYNMFKVGSCILIAVSGGVDSMVLAYILNKYKQVFDLKLKVAHLNHSLRGKEADKDEELVCSFCKENGIEFISKKVDVKTLAQKLKLGIEECARNERYKFFDGIIKEDESYIATAHNLSESAETAIFNLIRGSSLKGLQGIPAVRKNIVRPLIEITKEEIIAYAKENNIVYREDKSNFSLEYNRNKIRHKIIPVFKEINPSFEQALLRMKESVCADEEYLSSKANKEMQNIKCENGYSVLKLSKMCKALRFRVICKIMGNIKLETVHLNLINKLIKQNKGAVQINENIMVKVKHGVLSVCEIYKDKEKIEYFELPFEAKDIILANGDEYQVRLLEEKDIRQIFESDQKLFRNLIAYDIISRTALLRYRRKGDIFEQAYRKGIHKQYKKLMQEYKILEKERNSLLILSDKDNILWIEKIGASESARVKAETKKAILIEKRSNLCTEI